MIRLLATSAAAALVLASAFIGFDGGATAGTTSVERQAPLRTASMDEPSIQPERKPDAATTAPTGCARTVRVVGVGYGEPVINTCRAATPVAQPTRQ